MLTRQDIIRELANIIAKCPDAETSAPISECLYKIHNLSPTKQENNAASNGLRGPATSQYQDILYKGKIWGISEFEQWLAHKDTHSASKRAAACILMSHLSKIELNNSDEMNQDSPIPNRGPSPNRSVKVQAIKDLRIRYGLSLAAGKSLVDAYLE